MKKGIVWLIALFLATVCAAQNWSQPSGNPGDRDLPEREQPAIVPSQNQSQATATLGENKVIPAELSHSLDAKKCKVGEMVEAKSTMDLLAHGKIVLPRDTTIIGHVTAVKEHSKASPESELGIAFDRIVLKNGEQLPLQAEVQAIGRPISAFANPDPAPPSQMAGIPLSGLAPAMAADAPLPLNAAGDSPDSASPAAGPIEVPSAFATSALGIDSRGAVGFGNLSLNSSPQSSVVRSPKKNVRLDTGTQLILRMP